MNTIYFSLHKRQNTEEFHLFQLEKIEQNHGAHSLCNQLKLVDSEIILSELMEDQARMKCANGGKQVCGACVSQLYSDFTKS